MNYFILRATPPTDIGNTCLMLQVVTIVTSCLMSYPGVVSQGVAGFFFKISHTLTFNVDLLA